MRAVTCSGYGSPDRLRLQEVADPAPGAHELLIEVHAGTVNRTDDGVLRGKPFFIRFFYGMRGPKVGVLGSEFAGEVIGIGPGVTSFQIGDRVFGFDDSGFGGHAELKTIDERKQLAKLPPSLGYAEAAALPEGGLYALNQLRGAAVGPGSRVLIYGASGAIGSAAVQLAKVLGAEVTAVCSGRNVELVQGLGADRVIDYEREDFTASGGPYDAVIDAVGKTSFRRCRRVMTPSGIFCASDLGFLWQNPPLALWTSRLSERTVKIPLARSTPDDVAYLASLAEVGLLKPVIDRTYSLAQVPEAFGYVETKRKRGSVVVLIHNGE